MLLIRMMNPAVLAINLYKEGQYKIIENSIKIINLNI